MRMNSPYYRSYTDLPSRPRSVREIPVQFVGLERKEIRFENRSESALKIQKVLRGFLVRKCVKKITAVRAEVDEIEKRMSKEGMVELIAMDSKEKLRVNETLMNLLLKLDSVRGVDYGVRDYRKAVIKRVIALQERLDSVGCDSNHSNENVDQTVEGDRDDVDPTAMESTKMPCAEQTMEDDGNEVDSTAMVSTEIACAEQTVEDGNEVNPTAMESAEIAYTEQTVEDDGNEVDPTAAKSMEIACVDEAVKEECTENPNDEDIHDSCPEETVGPSQTESRSGSSSSVDPQSMVEPCEVEDEHDVQEKNEVGVEDKGEKAEEESPEDERVRKRELLLEKMMEDNEKMMKLMAQLFERNAMQTRLLSSLSQRVEQLERAYLCDKLRRKKKRQAASGAETVDGCDDMAPDVKKCGKR